MRIICLLALLLFLYEPAQLRATVQDIAGGASREARSDGETPKEIQCGRLLVRGVEQLTQTELCQLLDNVSSNPFDSHFLKSVEAGVIKEYNRRGFLETALRSWSESGTTPGAAGPTLIVVITEGPIYHLRRLEMIGNENTRDRVIRRRVVLQEGAAFDEELLDVSINRINQLGIFEEFTRRDVEVKVNRRGHFVDLTFHLVEKP